MERKKKNQERIPIAEWPELERKMGIIARMTSDPPVHQLSDASISSVEELDTGIVPSELPAH